jgi:hypothetical protein
MIGAGTGTFCRRGGGPGGRGGFSLLPDFGLLGFCVVVSAG